MPSEVVIAGAKRSLIGTDSGALSPYGAVDTASAVIAYMLRELEERASLFRREEIKAFISGICVSSNIGQNLPRQIMERCSILKTETAYTVNEMCGSGLEAVIQGYNAIKSGEYPLFLVGGVEMPLATPFYLTRQQLVKWRDKKLSEIGEFLPRGDLRDALWCSIQDVHTIVHAENTTAKWVASRGYDRETFKVEIDKYAVQSSCRAVEAQEQGLFTEEIVPFPDSTVQDEFPRTKKLSRLARLRGTHFTPDGLFLTSHNSPPLGNGAAYLLLADRDYAEQKGLPILARITGYSRSGVAPEDFLLAPLHAVKKLLNEKEMTIEDLDIFEMNSAYGSQMLINKEELNLPMERVNIQGDSIALGHPVGAAGARILTTLIHSLIRVKGKRGLTAICLGGGNGLAMSVERET